MKIEDIMSKDIATVNRYDCIKTAAELMEKYNVGSIPVCDNEEVVGIITDRDITIRTVVNGENPEEVKVSTVMTSNPVLINKDCNVEEASKIMGDRQVRRLPVVDDNKLVGMVSLGDIAIEPHEQNLAENALSDISQ